MRLESAIIGLAAALAAPAAAWAQGGAQSAIVSYPAAFFAGEQVANAAEMLARIPGFTLDVGDSVRGFEGAAGNVLIDGRRPTSKSDALDEILRRVPASQVERIDVIRGGAPGVDMQGKSVLANVVRKPGGGVQGLLSVAEQHLYDGREYPSARLELSGTRGPRHWEASARWASGVDDGGDAGPLVRTDPAGRVLRRAHVNGQSDGLDKVLTGAYEQPLLGGSARLNGRLYWRKWKTSEDDIPRDPPDPGLRQTSDETDFVRDSELGLRWTRSLGAKAGLDALALRQDGRQSADQVFVDGGTPTDFALLRHTRETILRAVVTYRAASDLSFEVGGETARNVLRSRTALAVDGAPQALPAANVRVSEARSEVFAKSSWRPRAGWTLDAALRYETSRIASAGDVRLEKQLSFVKPRLAAAWQATSATQLRLSLERVVGQLNFDDFVAQANFARGTGVSAGNPDLNPEQAWVLESAIEQKLPGGVTAVVTLRESKLSDVVDRGPVTIASIDPATGQPVLQTFDQPTNIGSGRKRELVLDLTAPSHAFGWNGGLLKANVTWRHSRVTDPTTGERRPISKLRPLEWQVTATQDLPGGRTTVGADLYGGWRETSYRFDTIETMRLHDAWFDVWVERKLARGLTLHVEFDNLAQRGISRTLRAYGGPRDRMPLAYVDDRDLHEGRNLFVRLRQTFGG